MLTAASLSVSLGAAGQTLRSGEPDPAGPFSAAATPMFDYVRSATPPDSTIVFYKPHLMHLLTDRDSFLTTNCRDLGKVDYAVKAKGEGSYNQISPDGILECSTYVKLERVLGKGDFVIYAITPAD